MIEIVRVVGDSYDLKTGEETGQLVVISNGITERSVPASEELLNAVLTLYAESMALSEVQSAPKEAVASRPQVRLQEVPPPAPRNGHPPKNPFGVVPGMPVGGDDEAPLEPGEEYADEATGTASI